MGRHQGFVHAINWLIDKWNGLSFTIPSISVFGKKIGGFTLSTPDIPRLAQGGITTGPTLAVIGDNPGGREAVIPLDKSGGVSWSEASLQRFAAILRDQPLNGTVAAGSVDRALYRTAI